MEGEKQDTKNKGRIQVTIQREDRLKTIDTLSRAIEKLADALNQTPKIIIAHNTISNVGTGIVLDNIDEIERTEIKELE